MCDDVAVVTVSGELDLALCIKLAPELNAAVRSTARAVVIDLEDVSLVDSSGIALLLNAFRHLDHAGRQLAIACPHGIAAPRVRADSPRSPAADARDPPRCAGCRTRQLTVFG